MRDHSVLGHGLGQSYYGGTGSEHLIQVSNMVRVIYIYAGIHRGLEVIRGKVWAFIYHTLIV